MSKAVTPFRIELNYCGVQVSFWLANLAYSGFTAVYLTAHGFTDAQIGFTSSFMAVLSMCFQLFTSGFSDQHQKIPLKDIMTAVMGLALLSGLALHFLPLPFALVLLVYAIGGGFQSTNVGLLNAQIMQYANLGIPVNYGWPRGVGSLVYALGAYGMGIMLERHSASILMPSFLAMLALAALVTQMMPNPNTLAGRIPSIHIQEKGSAHTTYRQMLLTNRPLLLFLLASVVLYFGQAPVMLFLVRVVQRAGGGGVELGITMLLQSGVEMPAMLLIPKLLKRHKPRNILMFAFASYTVKMLLLSLASSLSLVYFSMAISLFCYGLYGVASAVFVNGIVRDGEKVRAQGLIILTSNLGGILGNITGGQIIERLGLAPLLHFAWIMVAVSAGIMALCARADRQHSVRVS